MKPRAGGAVERAAEKQRLEEEEAQVEVVPKICPRASTFGDRCWRGRASGWSTGMKYSATLADSMMAKAILAPQRKRHCCFSRWQFEVTRSAIDGASPGTVGLWNMGRSRQRVSRGHVSGSFCGGRPCEQQQIVPSHTANRSSRGQPAKGGQIDRRARGSSGLVL
jgi:hypothetical protein